MIFVTVGTQLPFPRLIGAMEELATLLQIDVLAQTADPNVQSTAIRTRAFMPPDEFLHHFEQADIIVAHAGIGTIVNAARFRKPLILMPRRLELSEHRSDHQLATVSRFGSTPGIIVVSDTAELETALRRTAPEPVAQAAGHARQSLIDAIGQSLGPLNA